MSLPPLPATQVESIEFTILDEYGLPDGEATRVLELIAKRSGAAAAPAAGAQLDAFGRNALHHAVVQKRRDAALKHAALADVGDGAGWTPLHYCAFAGDWPLWRALLRRLPDAGARRAAATRAPMASLLARFHALQHGRAGADGVVVHKPRVPASDDPSELRRAVLRARKRILVFGEVVANALPGDADLSLALSAHAPPLQESPLWLAAVDAVRMVGEESGGSRALPAYALQMFAMNALRSERTRVCEHLMSLATPAANVVCKVLRDAAEQHTHAPVELDAAGVLPAKPLLSVGNAGTCNVYRLLSARRVMLEDGDAMLLPAAGQNPSMRMISLVREVQGLVGVAQLFALLDDALVELTDAADADAPATDPMAVLMAPLDAQVRHNGQYVLRAHYDARHLYAYALPDSDEACLKNATLVVVRARDGGAETTFLLELRSRNERSDFLRAVACARLQAAARAQRDPSPVEQRLLLNHDDLQSSLVRERVRVPLLHCYRNPVRGGVTVLLSDEMGTHVPSVLEHILRYKALCEASELESTDRFEFEMRSFFDVQQGSLLATPHLPAVDEHASAMRRTLRYFCALLGRLAQGDIEELHPVIPQLLNLAIGERTIASGVGKALHEVIGDFMLDMCALSSLRFVVLVYLWLNAQCERSAPASAAPAADSASRRHLRQRSGRATFLKGRAEAAFVAMKLQHEAQGDYLMRLKTALMQSHTARHAMLELVDYGAADAARSTDSGSSLPLVDFRVESDAVVVDGEIDMPDYAVLRLIEREKARRLAIFEAELDFAIGLVKIADRLVELQHDASASASTLGERRMAELRAQLTALNEVLAPGLSTADSSDDVFLPMVSESARVLSVSTLPDTLFVFKTKERAPFLCHIEYVHDSTVSSTRSTPAYSGRRMGTLHQSALQEHVRKALSSAPSKLERVGAVERHPLMEQGDGAATSASALPAAAAAASAAASPLEPDSVATDAFDISAVIARLRSVSPFASLPRWTCMSLIVKSNDDLAQEAFAMQLMSCLRSIWHADGIDVTLITYHVMAVAPASGFIETCHGALSIHALKKKHGPSGASLKQILIARFGSLVSDDAQRALRNFVRSLAAASVASYILQIKDRHNGNILVNNDFNVIHIDFGFFLTSSPANAQYETAPFKLTAEYLELLGGFEGALYIDFVERCMAAYASVRRHHQQLVQLVEAARGAPFSCFLGPGCDEAQAPAAAQTPASDDSFVAVSQRANPAGLLPPPGVDDDDDRYYSWLCDRHRVAMRQLIDRLQLQRTEQQAAAFVGELCGRAYWNNRTMSYDWFQWWQNGIYY